MHLHPQAALGPALGPDPRFWGSSTAAEMLQVQGGDRNVTCSTSLPLAGWSRWCWWPSAWCGSPSCRAPAVASSTCTSRLSPATWLPLSPLSSSWPSSGPELTSRYTAGVALGTAWGQGWHQHPHVCPAPRTQRGSAGWGRKEEGLGTEPSLAGVPQGAGGSLKEEGAAALHGHQVWHGAGRGHPLGGGTRAWPCPNTQGPLHPLSGLAGGGSSQGVCPRCGVTIPIQLSPVGLGFAGSFLGPDGRAGTGTGQDGAGAGPPHTPLWDP